MLQQLQLQQESTWSVQTLSRQPGGKAEAHWEWEAGCLTTGHYQKVEEAVIKIYVFSSIWHKLSSN